MALISICIAAYNSEKYIVRTLESILNQSFRDFELIVVNDGSTDATLNLLNQIKDKRLKIFSIENSGQCTALNYAFNQSSAAYIKFMDADDLISPTYLELQYQAIVGHDDTIASASWGRFYNNDLSTFQLSPETVWRDMDSLSWIKESLLSEKNMMQCALFLIPRKVLEKSGLWDTRLTLINDFEFFIRVILKSKKIKYVKDAILYYNSGIQNSVSNYKTEKAFESGFLSTYLGTKHLLDMEDSPETRKITANYFQLLKYEVYPKYMDIYNRCEKLIIANGGSDFKIPLGGISAYLSKLFGWKAVKQFKYLIGK